MYSDNYLNWVKENNISGLTRTQYKFAEFCLSNHKDISVIGDVENTFKNIRLWIKNSNQFVPPIEQAELKEKAGV